MSGVTSGRILLTTVTLAIGLTITAFIGAHFIGSRYESRIDGAWLYVVDRLTGAVKSCNHRRGCTTLANDAETAPETAAAKPATEQPAPTFDTSRLRPIDPAGVDPEPATGSTR